MIRMSGNAACVTASTTEKLQGKGWAPLKKNSIPNLKKWDRNKWRTRCVYSPTDDTKGTNHSVELEESVGLKRN